ncbi:MAG TPA: TadE/TadG family type IV pilus assembly protein [Aliidongia sp.]|nr:TadE/TadG family type IV pilus assembly protein [Aliidongia sp.]
MFPSVAKASSRKRLSRFRRDDHGTVAVIFALSLVPFILSMGLAVDLSRAYMARAKLTAALDAAALAVGATPNLYQASQSSISTTVTNYLHANFPNTNLVTIGTTTVTPITPTSSTVTVTATANVKTTFMALGGFSTVAVSSQSTVALAKNLEVAMVLDNTGSLSHPNQNWTPVANNPTTANENIIALKTAAGHFVITLFGSTTTNNPQTRIGIVPYVAAVNPGVVAPNMVNSATAPAYTPNDVTGWTGCVVERQSTFATVAAAPTPAAAANAVALDLDTPVSGSSNNYLTAYHWPNNGHATTPVLLDWTAATIFKGPYHDGFTAPGPNQSCPTPVVPLTNNLQPLLNSIGADASGNGIINSGLQDWQNGGTIGSIGMAWGYRLLSPNGPYAAAAAETVSNWNAAPWQKAVVLMTDGVNNLNKNNAIAGGKIADYNGAPTNQQPPDVPTVDKQEEAVCDALKAQNVIIYTVYLNSGSPNTPPVLVYCAGTVPGVGDTSYSYTAQNQAALYAAFDSIANSLTKLRVTK